MASDREQHQASAGSWNMGSRWQGRARSDMIAPAASRAEPLSHRLARSAAALLIPALMLGAGTLWLQDRADRARAEDQLVHQARSLARLVDREFDRAEGIAVALANSAALARSDLGA